MLQSEFSAALNQLASERNVTPEAVLETIRTAMVSAYRKEYGGEDVDEIDVIIDPESGETKLMQDGKDITPSGFGRIAAQTAKQVILQKINEAEKEAVIAEYRKKLGSIVSGTVFRVDRGLVVVELGKAHGVMPPKDQIPNEHYQLGRRIRFLLLEISEGERGEDIILSRSHPDFVKELFALEVPEIASGTVKIEAVAREAGLRTKIAVSASSDKVDPVGSCVGQKGVRVMAVMDELGDERIDIIPYNPEVTTFIANALSPAKVKSVEMDQEKSEASVEVDEDQLSLAIGKGGQNVRLAAKLTGWKIDVKGSGSNLSDLGLSTRTENALIAGGVLTLTQLKNLSAKELGEIKGIGKKALSEIQGKLPAPKEGDIDNQD